MKMTLGSVCSSPARTTLSIHSISRLLGMAKVHRRPLMGYDIRGDVGARTLAPDLGGDVKRHAAITSMPGMQSLIP